LTKIILQKIFEDHWPELKIGVKTMKQFWVEVSKISLKKINPVILSNKYYEAIWIDKKLLNIIKKLIKNYKIVMIANDSDDIYLSKIQKFKLERIFDKLYCSSQLGISKPNSRIFKYVLDDLKIKPREMLFIDNQDNNIESAKKLNINTILFSTIDKLMINLPEFFV